MSDFEKRVADNARIRAQTTPRRRGPVWYAGKLIFWGAVLLALAALVAANLWAWGKVFNWCGG